LFLFVTGRTDASRGRKKKRRAEVINVVNVNWSNINCWFDIKLCVTTTALVV
jgi:hypothetical protein